MKVRKVWKIIAHHENPDGMIKWSRKNGRIAIGFECIGDLRELRPVSHEKIREQLKQKCRDIPNVHTNTGSKSLLNFWNIGKGDLAIISRGSHGSKGFSHVVKIIDGYTWESEERSFDNYRHQRVVDVLDDKLLGPDELWDILGRKVANGQGKYWTVAYCGEYKGRRV